MKVIYGLTLEVGRKMGENLSSNCNSRILDKPKINLKFIFGGVSTTFCDFNYLGIWLTHFGSTLVSTISFC